MASGAVKGSVARVAAALAEAGFGNEIVALDQSTRTSAEAAAAVGCEVAQIAKSLVFRGARTGRPVLVVASGTNRVDEAKVAALLDEPVERPDGRFVRAETGFAIGGVAPIGHARPLTVLLDADLGRHDAIWAAAGSPHAVFRLTFDELCRMTGGTVAAVS